MPSLTTIELDYLRHLVGNTQAGAAKITAYAEQSEDPDLRSFLEQEAQTCRQRADTLMNFLRQAR